jgi:hypothetical protein
MQHVLHVIKFTDKECIVLNEFVNGIAWESAVFNEPLCDVELITAQLDVKKILSFWVKASENEKSMQNKNVTDFSIT